MCPEPQCAPEVFTVLYQVISSGVLVGRPYLTYDEAVEFAQESGLAPEANWTVIEIRVPDGYDRDITDRGTVSGAIYGWLSAVGASHLHDSYWFGYYSTVEDQYPEWSGYVAECFKDDNKFRQLLEDFVMYCHEVQDAKHIAK